MLHDQISCKTKMAPKMAAKTLRLATFQCNTFPRVVILVSTLFYESGNLFLVKYIMLNNQISCKTKMAPEMAAITLQMAIIKFLFSPRVLLLVSTQSS